LQPLEIPLSFLRTLLMFQYLDQAWRRQSTGLQNPFFFFFFFFFFDLSVWV
jgi:hypothetical protein